MTDSDFQTAIIGSGFAGATVAHAMGGEGVVLLDRGEPLDLAEATGRVVAETASPRRPGSWVDGQLPHNMDSEVRSMASALEQNRLDLPLSGPCINMMTYVQGGISNMWGGYAQRITEATFAMDGVLAWPIGLRELDPFYAQAEQLLRVHGDPSVTDHAPYGPLPGWDLWRDYFKTLFPQARVSPVAKNITDRDSHHLGLCLGNGSCHVCPNDAKATPANTFPELDVVAGTRVEQIVFEGRRAVALRGSANGEAFEVSVDRVVVAAGGLENAALLRRSGLPPELHQRIGNHYQDHTACEIVAVLPRRFERYALGAEGGVEVPELSGYIEGIEVSTKMLTSGLTPHHMQGLIQSSSSLAALQASHRQNVERTASFYLMLEVPPEWRLRLRTRGDRSFIQSNAYFRNIPTLDLVVAEVARRMMQAGLQVVGFVPQHRHFFGCHHFCGTTPMSRHGNAVVDENLRLVGTDNVYVSGGSVLPRCGGAGPTLSIAAMGLRLGAHLRATAH